MKRVALRILIGSVVASALLGIWALLSGDFGELERKVLLTSLCVSGASILAMACAAAWDKGPWPLIPRAGMGLAIGGFAVLIVLIWSETEAEEAWKSAASLLILATAAAHASLLGLARLKPRHAWLLPAAWLSATLLAALLIGSIWGEWDDDDVGRWIGVLSILLCAFTILVPMFQRVGRTDEVASNARVRFCPACGQALDAPYGDVACNGCGAGFRIASRTGLPGQASSSSSSSSSSSTSSPS